MLFERADWLARRLLANTIHLRAAEEKQDGSRFARVTKDEINSINEAAVKKNTKMATKFG